METSFWINQFCNCNALSTRRRSEEHTNVVSRSMIRLGSGKEHKTHSYIIDHEHTQTRLLYNEITYGWCEQDPMSTMQKTGWTNYSSFVIWSGPDWPGLVQSGQEKLFWSLAHSRQPFSFEWGHFGMVTTTKLPGDPRASLLLTTQKVIFCNALIETTNCWTVKVKISQNAAILALNLFERRWMKIPCA